MKKLICVLTAIVLLTMASCESFLNKVLDKLEEFAESVEFILDNYQSFKNPVNVNGDGETVDYWVGEALDPEFTMPEFVEKFVGGYIEENDMGAVYCNLTIVPSLEDMDAFVQSLRARGYDAYNEHMSWSIYNIMLLFPEEGKLCMAVEKDGVYIQIAYYSGAEGDANAVFSIATYDLLVETEDEDSSSDTDSESTDSSSGEDNTDPTESAGSSAVEDNTDSTESTDSEEQ